MTEKVEAEKKDTEQTNVQTEQTQKTDIEPAEKTTPKSRLEELREKTWPKVRVEMERGIQEAKRVVIQGEKYAEEITDRGLKRLRITVLKHRCERRFHDLGKTIAGLARGQWDSDESVTGILKDITKIKLEIKELQEELDSDAKDHEEGQKQETAK